MKKETKTNKKQVVKKQCKKAVPQIEKLYNYLSKHGKITRVKAVSIGITSVSGAVSTLKSRGVKIETTLKSVKGKTFASYTLSK